MSEVEMARTKQTMRVSSSTKKQLPTEVLERIFRHLPFKDLLKIRQSCTEFRKIVNECSKLKDRFRLKFPMEIKTIDKSFNPESLIPASGAFFEHLNVVNVSSWWPRIAGDITQLVMKVCDFPLDILRFTPNLMELKLEGVKLTNPVNTSFKLKKMKNLSVKHCSIDIWDNLDQIIQKPLIKFEFEMNVKMNYEDQQKVIQFITFRQDTLEEMYLHPVEGMLERISRLNQAKLKRVMLSNFQNTLRSGELHLIRFARAQPTIEELTIKNVPIRPNTIREMGQGMPRLKRFVLHLTLQDGSELETAAKSMPNLEYLELAGPVTLNKCHGENRNQHLKELVLKNVEISKDNLKKFLQYTPYLRKLSLEFCKFDNWSDFTELVSELYCLQHLRLHFVSIRNHDEYDDAEHVNQSLKCLDLDGNANFTTYEVCTMFLMFPELKEVRYSALEKVDRDGVMQELGITGKTVRKLVLRNSRLSQGMVQNIVEYCAELERVEIEGSTELTREELGRFRAYMVGVRKELVEK